MFILRWSFEVKIHSLKQITEGNRRQTSSENVSMSVNFFALPPASNVIASLHRYGH